MGQISGGGALGVRVVIDGNASTEAVGQNTVPGDMPTTVAASHLHTVASSGSKTISIDAREFTGTITERTSHIVALAVRI